MLNFVKKDILQKIYKYFLRGYILEAILKLPQ